MRGITSAIALLALVACANGSSESTAPSTPAAAIDPNTVATLRGRVLVQGTVAGAEIMRLDGDPKCAALAAGEERRAEHVVVGDDNTLQNVFVYVKDGLPAQMYPVPAQVVVLDQQKCRYVPRVLGIQVGQELVIRNSDPLLHNVRSEGAINEPFDVGTPIQGMEVKKSFATREVMVPFKCNVHSWMNAYVGVLEHPFFGVTDRRGTFAIANVPPGTYTLEMWHEKFGTQTQQVTVAARESKDVTFTVKAS